MMNKRPMIVCPHCGEHVAADRLPPQRTYRNEYGVDVFGCPKCKEEFKFEGSEYLALRARMENGEIPEGAALDAVKIHETLASERMVLEYARRPTAPWRGPAKALLVLGALVMTYLIIR